jgi:hypothetical protein
MMIGLVAVGAVAGAAVAAYKVFQPLGKVLALNEDLNELRPWPGLPATAPANTGAATEWTASAMAADLANLASATGIATRVEETAAQSRHASSTISVRK